ncbi:unnamed protein product [marine sediment metagenome]|uniref:Uncharacterized protein n=1 Tax=marine sediment metagenome TaxID=412755 RepID=X1TNF2_9ZZZZ
MTKFLFSKQILLKNEIGIALMLSGEGFKGKIKSSGDDLKGKIKSSGDDLKEKIKSSGDDLKEKIKKENVLKKLFKQ